MCIQWHNSNADSTRNHTCRNGTLQIGTHQKGYRYVRCPAYDRRILLLLDLDLDLQSYLKNDEASSCVSCCSSSHFTSHTCLTHGRADVHYHSKTGKHETELRNCSTKDKVEVFRHDPAEYCTQRRCFLLKKFKKIQKSGRLAR